jgi:hypothetical protein
MAVYSQTDTNAFFSDASTTATYKIGKTRFNVRGIFDSPYQGINIAEPEFASERVTFVLPSNGLPANAEPGDKFIYDCDTYTVREIQPDGTGVTTLVLEASTDLDAPT